MKTQISSLFNTIRPRILLPALAAACALIMPAFASSAFAAQKAVAVTVAPDYSSGAHSVISVAGQGGEKTVANDLLPDVSDMTIASYGSHFYRIKRGDTPSVTKFHVDSPTTPVWEYSTEGLDESSNPHDMIFVSENRAFILRYGATAAWIVNPSATDEAGFKIGELDLSSYADEDGAPEMHAGAIADGKLFIVLQRLISWAPSITAYVAVFDAATGMEIDTGIANADNVKGIPLPVRNPVSIQYLASANTLYVTGVGSYPGYGDPALEYTGGIATINPATYAAGLLVDDGDADNHPNGSFSGMSIVSPTKGYFVGYHGWGDNSLYPFNPTTGVVGDAVDALSGKSISGMESGTALDENGFLWVCNATDARIDILDPATDTVTDSVSTNLNPSKIVFANSAETPQPTDILTFSIDGLSLTMNWNFPGGADSYTLYYAPTSDHSNVQSIDLGTIIGNTYTGAHGTSLIAAIGAKKTGEPEVYSNIIEIIIP